MTNAVEFMLTVKGSLRVAGTRWRHAGSGTKPGEHRGVGEHCHRLLCHRFLPVCGLPEGVEWIMTCCVISLAFCLRLPLLTPVIHSLAGHIKVVRQLPLFVEGNGC